MNLFQKPKLELYVFQQYFTPPTLPLKQDESNTNFSPVTSQAHPSYVQQFLSIHVSNHTSHCQTDTTTHYGHKQRDSCVWLHYNSNTNPLNRNVSKQRNKNYGKRKEISVSLAILALPMEQKELLKCIVK